MKKNYFFKECLEYSQINYRYETVRTMFGRPFVKKIGKCAHTAVGLISGGVQAKTSEFPHMAHIALVTGLPSDEDFICGGSIISNR